MNKKIKKLAWTNDMVKVIAQNYKTKSAREIAVILNDKFGTSRTAEGVHSKGNHHGFEMARG